jgi:hypothetical protein
LQILKGYSILFSKMIKRTKAIAQVAQALGWSRAVALVGPRQCGKTTLAREFVAFDSPNYFDLEDNADLARLENPAFAFSKLEGLVVIDEIQRRPDLFPSLRVQMDRPSNKAKFLILGSASPELLQQSSETLAGRIATIELDGFSLDELGTDSLETLWSRGGFPLSFLAGSDEESIFWRKNFSRDFLERDLGQLGFQIPPQAMGRFWKMVAHYHGQNLNASELARSLGVSAPTVRRYLDILSGAFMLRQLQPWFENIKKRQVKSPKIYYRDTGLLHYQLGIPSYHELLAHPKVGASWEGFAIEQAIRFHQPDEQYFWSTQSDAELDLLLFKDGRRIGLECKLNDAPRITKSMRTAMEILKLDELKVIHTGSKSYELDKNVHAIPLSHLI